MTDFHFIRPIWFVTLPLLLLTLYWLKRLRVSHSGWQQFLPKHLNNVLVTGDQNQKSYSLFWPTFIGIVAIIALAGPTWKKLPQPVFQLDKGAVLVMDMSYSMYSTDLQPNRLTRARFKAIDLLNTINEGQIGLVAYAGDAFTISPLTEDINNIKLLLPSLSPDIMPVPGSNPLAAMDLAGKMLKNAGHPTGEIYWFTDGIDSIDRQDLIDWSRKTGNHINILGIGTAQGAPIKLPNGELMKDDNGAIIIPPLSINQLQTVAKNANGKFTQLSNTNSDINQLVNNSLTEQQKKKASKNNSNHFGDQWQEFGPYLVLILLPIVLSYFRRGFILSLIPLLCLHAPTPAYASVWNDLWKTKAQQGQQQFDQQQYQQAAKLFSSPLRKGNAFYKAGDYEKALNQYKQVKGAVGSYNRGNALAKLKKIDEAISAYNEALKADPSLTNAKENKALLEKLKQQNKNQKNKQNDKNNQQNKDKKNQQKGKNNKQNKDKKDQQNGKNQQSKQQSSDQKQANKKQSSSQSNQQQSEKQKQNQQKKSKEQQKNKQESQNKKQQKQKNQQVAKQSENDSKNKDKKQAAQSMTAEQRKKQKEAEQKYQQLLNKVTDDPYLLLRNKMQLEYQKRRQNGELSGVKKKW